MQRHLARFRNAIGDAAFELRIQRQHRPKNFTERRKIIVGDPAAETQQLLVENRCGIEHAQNWLDRDRWLTVMQLHDDPSQALLTKRHEHPSAHHGRSVVHDMVGKNHVQRHRQSNVAILRH